MIKLFIGNKIKLLRESKELTLKDVAKALGVATQTVHKYESGVVSNIPLDKLEKLSAVLGCDISYLVGEIESNPVTKEEAMLLELFRKVPESDRSAVVETIRVTLEVLKKHKDSSFGKE